MAIKGEWGAGKTCGWKKFLSEANSANGLRLERHSHVFFLESIHDPYCMIYCP